MRGGRLVGVLAAMVTFGTCAAPGLARAAAAPGRPDGTGAARAVIQLWYSPPVLVRAGERVDLPVDAACVTSAGAACGGVVTVSARNEIGSAWTSASSPSGASLHFDLSAPASRAVAGDRASGAVDFRVSALGSGASATLGSAREPLRFYVTRSMATIRVPDVPFGRVAPGRTALFVPWGSGPGRAGLALGLETATLGPASFDVGSGGRITVLDGLHQRLLTGGGSGRLTSFPVGRSSPDSDIALAPDGGAYVLSSAGGRGDRPVTVRWVSLGDVPNSAADDRRAPVMVGRGLPVRLALAGAAPYVHLLPTDEWSEAEYPNGPLTPGRPLAGGGQLLSVVREGAVRLAVARGRRVLAPVELRFAASVADLQLAALDGDGGYIVVVHLWRDEPAADQYQVVHVAAGRVVQTFAVARKDFARTAALSAFRLGHDGSLFQLTSSPDGVRVLRYEIGGAA